MTQPLDSDRFDRNIRVLGETGQHQLNDTHLTVVGVGGLGSLMAEQLGRLGITHLTLIDPDIVENSNLPRLFGATDTDVGRPKVSVVREHLQQIDPAITISTRQEPIQDAEHAIAPTDIVIAGLDTAAGRITLNRAAVNHETPYIDAGVTITTADGTDRVDAMEGYIQLIVPGETACLDCLDRYNPEQARLEQLSHDELQEHIDRGYIEDTALSPEPAIVPLNGVIASKAVGLAVKHLTGYDRPTHYLRIDTLGNTIDATRTTPNDGCPTCGEHGLDELDLDTAAITDR
jgi:molybdopterin/thiamine biosynthesis adenylyltransferase